MSQAKTFEYIPENVLANVFSYLTKDQITSSLVTLDKSIVKLVNKLGNDNIFWKELVETMIDHRLPQDAVEDWKTVYNQLLKLGDDPIAYFLDACEYGYVSIVKVLLKDIDVLVVDPAIIIEVITEGLVRAIENNREAVLKLLLIDSRFNPKYNNTLGASILYTACSSGFIDVVRLLLTDQRIVDADDGSCIYSAIDNNRTNIVELLLNESSIDPTMNNNEALMTASNLGNADIVKLLMDDPRIGKGDTSILALEKAVAAGHLDVVRLLIDVYGADPTYKNNHVIIKAAESGHVDVVKWLLKNPRVDPSDQDNKAIISAARRLHVEVVKLLLADPRVDPSDQEDEALLQLMYAEPPVAKYRGAKNMQNKLDIIRLLLADTRVDSIEAIITVAEDMDDDDDKTYNTQLAKLEILLGHPRIPLKLKDKYTVEKIPPGMISMSLDELLDLNSSKSDITNVLRAEHCSCVLSKYYWWSRLEKYHSVSSEEIMAMDPNADPLALCMEFE